MKRYRVTPLDDESCQARQSKADRAALSNQVGAFGDSLWGVVRFLAEIVWDMIWWWWL